MRRRHRAPLSASQWALFVTAGYFVSGVFAFPRVVAGIAGRAGLWAVVTDGVIFGGVLWATVQVRKRQILPTFHSARLHCILGLTHRLKE